MGARSREITVNRHLQTVLLAKGYEATHYGALGGHDAAYRLTTPDLQALLSKREVPDAPRARHPVDSMREE